MKALMYQGPRQMPVVDIPEPSPRENEVKIRVRYCGICGSDLHGYTGESGRKIPPMIMGHEFSGVVAETGRGVTRFHAGDRVSVQPVQYCGECEFCRRGSMNVCANRRGLGVLDINGAFTEYICVPEKNVYPLPDTVSDAEGAVLEPLAVACHAVAMAGPIAGKTVLIAGAGTIGLLVLMLVKAKGAGHIIVTGRRENRLELARRLGADYAVNSDQEDMDQILRQAGLRDSIDIALECAGVTATCQQTVDFVKIQGRIIWVGNAAKMVTVNMQQIVTRELSIRGTYAFTEEDFSQALQLLEEKAVPAADIVTRIVPLRDAAMAFEESLARGSRDLKVLVDVNGDSCHETCDM